MFYKKTFSIGGIMSLFTPVLGALGLLTIWHTWNLGRDVTARKNEWEPETSFVTTGVIGFFVNFLDTLGIGSFAPSTFLYKSLKQVKDRIIPGTLNVANTIPTVLEALIFITVIEVEPVTLLTMIGSATAGAWFGAGIIAKLNTKAIQRTMGTSLFVVAFIMLAGKMQWFPIGGEDIGLSGMKLLLGIGGNFVLGVLMTAGIGLYAPCMALVYFLGMSPKVAFPIMMGSCAFLMPVASAKFIREGAYNRKASIAISIMGAFGVLIAAYIVKSLPIEMLKWLVMAVVLYTSIIMLKQGFSPEPEAQEDVAN